jgi:hypothetical protein
MTSITVSARTEVRAKSPGQPVGSIPCEGAEVVVTIDGRPYAGFINRGCAEVAVALWSGETDGGGLPVPQDERTRHGWPAARGRLLEIVDRNHGRVR